MVMSIKEQKLLEWLHRKDPHSKYMVHTLVKLHNSLCETCQRDRIRCSIEPLCPSRIYLNMLIEADVPKKELPQFCYKRRGEEIKRFFLGKNTIVPLEDASYFLDDFLSLFFKKNKKEKLMSLFNNRNFKEFIAGLGEILDKYFKEYDYEEIDRDLYLILNKSESIVKFSYDKKLITVNLKERRIKDYTKFFKLAKLISRANGLKIEIFSNIGDIYYVKIPILFDSDTKISKKELDNLRSELLKHTNYLLLKQDKNHLNLTFTLIDPTINNPEMLKISRLLNVFQIIRRFTDKVKGEEG